MTKERLGLMLIALCGLLVVTWLSWQGPIAQALSYHNFSDPDTLLGLPNALNVLSNLPLLLVGVWGLITFSSSPAPAHIEANHRAYYLLFSGITLVAIGSGYYHLNPNNDTLFWDRLPMALAFMSLLSIIIGECIKPELGEKALVPLIGVGLFSVIYWQYTEAQGAGDLRLYALVQLAPILATPIMLLCCKSTFNQTYGYWGLLACYLAAKLFEHFDAGIHEVLGVISGHSLKHLAAAIGMFVLLHSYRRRSRL